MAQPHQNRRPRGRRLVAAIEFLAGFDQRQRFRGINAQCFQHAGRKHFAHAALEGQPAVAAARPRRYPAPLGPEIEQAPIGQIEELGIEKAAPVAEIGIVAAELVAVIAQSQRPGKTAGKRREPAEMCDPVGIAQPVQPDLGGGAIVAEAQPRRRKVRGPHAIVECVPERQDARLGPICLRFGGHV